MTIFQKPNLSLVVAFVSFVIAKASFDPIRTISSVMYLIAILIWAGAEILTGANWLRRLLGIVVIIWTLASLLFHLN